MIVGRGVGDWKADGDLVEEWRVHRGRAGGAEVGADVEEELVAPELHVGGTEEWGIQRPSALVVTLLTRRVRPSASTRARSIRRPAAGRPRDVSRTWVVRPGLIGHSRADRDGDARSRRPGRAR